MQDSAARIESQLELIAASKRHGRDTTHAMEILEEFCKSYAMRAGIVERLRTDLARPG
jgi:hypothetical protein